MVAMKLLLECIKKSVNDRVKAVCVCTDVCTSLYAWITVHLYVHVYDLYVFFLSSMNDQCVIAL